MAADPTTSTTHTHTMSGSRVLPAAPRALAALGVALAVALLVPATPAHACGGFFCSQVPVDQAGERIVFGVGEGTVSATIQINFAGAAEDFAWVVPVHSAPEISVGSQSMFSILNNFTAPQYYLNWDYGDGTCGLYPPMADGAGGGGPGEAGGGGVVVLEEKEVGPYDVAVVSSDDASALIEWLNDNNFDQPEESTPIIEHYVAQGMLFVAMKLNKDSDVGDLQPVTLLFESDEPCVPLVLTRIAAMPDMPVLVWIFSQDRAVPANWFEVQLNEAKLDWFTNAGNYDEVVSAAVDEAAGHAFVTEYAQTVDVTGWFFTEGQWDTEALAQFGNPAQFLDEALWMGLPRDAQMQALIREYIPMPAGLPEECQDESAFYNWNKEYCFSLMPDDWSFDAVGFAADIEERVVEPLRDAQKMADHFDYLTRLYTTVSAEEMTRDPMFAFNPDLPDVSNVHYADAVGICSEDGSEILEVTITLANGESFVVQGPIDVWGWGWGGGGDSADYTDPVPEQPAASAIQILGSSGPPQSVAPEDVEEAEQSFALADPTTLPWDGELPDDGGTDGGGTDGGGTDGGGSDGGGTDGGGTDGGGTDGGGTDGGGTDGGGTDGGGTDQPGGGDGTGDGTGTDDSTGGGTTGDDGTLSGSAGGTGQTTGGISVVEPSDEGCTGGTAPLGTLGFAALALLWVTRRRG